MTKRIDPKEVRYIKLGQGGQWAQQCFETGTLQFNYPNIPHEFCIQGDWDAVKQRFVDEGRSGRDASDATREIREFYELGANTLWVTIDHGRLYWVFAEPEVIWVNGTDGVQGPRQRKIIGEWRYTTIDGHALDSSRLSTAITRVASYQRTICRIKEEGALLRRINSEESLPVRRAQHAHDACIEAIRGLIKELHQTDFETLTDLLFARLGWRRVSRVGENQKDVDLILEQPATSERIAVQIKSSAGQTEFEDHIDKMDRYEQFDRTYFVCHSPKGAITSANDNRHQFLGDNDLAKKVFTAGLFEWVLERVA